MGKSRLWTKQEVEFLEQRYGAIKIKTIANKLNRTVLAVELKAQRLGLGGALMNTEYITAKSLSKALKVDRHVVTGTFVKHKLPIQKRVVRNSRQFHLIKIEMFWKWAKQNKELINFSKLEENILGCEPEWVKEQREIDKTLRPKREKQKWTKEEDSRLKMYWSHKTAEEIGKLLNRSKEAICRRSQRLKLKRKKIQITWKKTEVKILVKMKLEGKTDKEVAYALGRTQSQVRYKRNNLVSKKIFKMEG